MISPPSRVRPDPDTAESSLFGNAVGLKEGPTTARRADGDGAALLLTPLLLLSLVLFLGSLLLLSFIFAPLLDLSLVLLLLEGILAALAVAAWMPSPVSFGA